MIVYGSLHVCVREGELMSLHSDVSSLRGKRDASLTVRVTVIVTFVTVHTLRVSSTGYEQLACHTWGPAVNSSETVPAVAVLYQRPHN